MISPIHLSSYMPDSPSLVRQLANRAKLFHNTTRIPQSLVAEAIDMEDSNYSAFLAGKHGLSAESTCQLLRLMSLTKQEAIKLGSTSR